MNNVSFMLLKSIMKTMKEIKKTDEKSFLFIFLRKQSPTCHTSSLTYQLNFTASHCTSSHRPRRKWLISQNIDRPLQ